MTLLARQKQFKAIKRFTVPALPLRPFRHHSDAVARFDGNTDHHHHLVCLGCDRVTDLDGLELDFIKLPEARRKGFEIADFSIHFEGYCPECRRNKKTKTPSPRAGLRRQR